jgi:hypothetical protein
VALVWSLASEAMARMPLIVWLVAALWLLLLARLYAGGRWRPGGMGDLLREIPVEAATNGCSCLIENPSRTPFPWQR